jgi:hypothetical protein
VFRGSRGEPMPDGWEEEWRTLTRWRDEALARLHGIQAEITASIRRRQPPPMKLLRAADEATGELAAAKAKLRQFLRQTGTTTSA